MIAYEYNRTMANALRYAGANTNLKDSQEYFRGLELKKKTREQASFY